MNRTNETLVLLVVAGFAAGCGGFGGGGNGGGGGGSLSGSTAPVGSASYIPSVVTRATNYKFETLFTPVTAAGGAITAIGVAPTTTDCWIGVSPLGEVDHVSNAGQQTEVSFVFDVSSFAVIGSNVFASTSNPIASYAGCVYSRDPQSTIWGLTLDGSQNECVCLSYLDTVFAFQGLNDGPAGAVSVLTSATNSWTNIATIGSMVPASACVYNGTAFVGGRSNDSSGGPAWLVSGDGTTFTPTNVPVQVGFGQIASVQALAVANNTLFAAVEVKDAVSGDTLSGAILYLDTTTNALVVIDQMQKDAPICLAAADGTIYAGSRNGQLLWLGTDGKWNPETSLPVNLGVTAIAWDGMELEVGYRSDQGAQFAARLATGPSPVATTGFAFGGMTPTSGPVAGGTAVTITGSDLGTVTVVTIGGVPLTNLIVTSTEITGTTPAGTAGAQNVIITSPSSGSLVEPSAFTYQSSTTSALSYATSIEPVLNNTCNVCHSGNGYHLTPYSAIMSEKSAAGVAYVVPGNPAGSWLAQKLDATLGGANATMAGYAPSGFAKTVETWIQQGANP
jgi:hypothetical protein